MQDDLKERLRAEVVVSEDPPTKLIIDGQEVVCAGSKTTMRRNPDGPEAADRIAALEAKLAEKDALLRECGEGLAGPNAWLERWASHVGGCHGGSLCQCGLTLAKLESATTLAKIKDATDAD